MNNAGMIDSRTIRAYVINLRRRPDRRSWITRALPTDLAVTFTSDLVGDPALAGNGCDPFDGRNLSIAGLEAAGCGLFAWQIDSPNPWWARPLKFGEIGCALAHLACWRHAAAHGDEPYVLVLEDDAVVAPDFPEQLRAGLARLSSPDQVDLVYLGRVPLEPDLGSVDGFVVPGYSHCTYGYLLARDAVPRLLEAELDKAIIPVDEFLPALYLDHPRADVRVRFPRRLRALAFEPPLVTQRAKDDAGSDTEDSPFVIASASSIPG